MDLRNVKPIDDFSDRYDETAKAVSALRKAVDSLALIVAVVGIVLSVEIFAILFFSL